MGAAEGAHVVYPKAWAATPIFQPPVGEDDVQKTQQIFDSYKSWKATPEYMSVAHPEAIYMHCLPADRSWEVEDAVIDNTEAKSGWRSVVFDEAENRLHVQKAVMSLVMK
jgi:N-acetylornithine carbamoyltransferase